MPVSQEETARHRVSGAFKRLAPSADVLGRIARLLEEGTIRPDVANASSLQDAAKWAGNGKTKVARAKLRGLIAARRDGIGWESGRNASKSAGEFESKVKEKIGPSGFIRFLTIDHGSWLSLLGQPAKLRMYTIGNPLIAITMLRHNIAAGLNVPVRLAIYQDEASGTTRLIYDQPSGLMSGIGNPSLMEAAEALDAKLAALAEQVTGAQQTSITVL